MELHRRYEYYVSANKRTLTNGFHNIFKDYERKDTMSHTWTEILAALTDSELLDLLTETDGYKDEMLTVMAEQELELRSIQHGIADYDCLIPDCDDLWLGGEDVWRHRKTTFLH